jgi:dihydroorotase
MNSALKTTEQDTSDMEPERTAAEAARYPGLIVGIKIAHYAGPEWIAVDRAVDAGRLAKLPVMVDFAEFRKERPFQQLVLEHLRPGDIYTHLYLGAVPMLDPEGTVLPYLFEARKRGVIFDVGHGGGSFQWRQAAPAVRRASSPIPFPQTCMSSMNAGMKDMLNVMSVLTWECPLEDVVHVRRESAREITRRTGHLSVGAVADIAVLRWSKAFRFPRWEWQAHERLAEIGGELTIAPAAWSGT